LDMKEAIATRLVEARRRTEALLAPFEACPSPEYSQVFLGSDYKVLRGASGAARPSVARAALRNRDHPIRRLIFAGLRCAAGSEEA
jgi:formylglycine-generating enzyme required for sulfatase activity